VIAPQRSSRETDMFESCPSPPLVPVYLKVCEILGGFGPGKQEEAIQTGERTGTICKVIGRVAAQSQNSKTLSCGIMWEAGGGEMQVNVCAVFPYHALFTPCFS
jgi:hypothetical protein